jgi:hypothetical protein
MREGDLAVPPSAQPDQEEDDVGLLQQTVTGDENYNYDGQLYEEEQPLLVESQSYNNVTRVDEDETVCPQHLMANFQMNFPQLFVPEEPEMMYGAAGFADQATPLSNFFENVQQDFWSEYQNVDAMMPVADLAMPAAQPEDDDAAGEVPRQNFDDDGQMYTSLGEQQPQPDKTAAGEAIYGLPCPAFSTEMTRRCNDDLMMPWQSPSSMSMTLGMY